MLRVAVYGCTQYLRCQLGKFNLGETAGGRNLGRSQVRRKNLCEHYRQGETEKSNICECFKKRQEESNQPSEAARIIGEI